MLLMFTARNYKVNGTKTCRMHVLNVVCTIYTLMFGDERFKRYGCSDRVCFQTLSHAMRFQTGYYSRKGMVVQQDFEKGRSHRLWFRRYDR